MCFYITKSFAKSTVCCWYCLNCGTPFLGVWNKEAMLLMLRTTAAAAVFVLKHIKLRMLMSEKNFWGNKIYLCIHSVANIMFPALQNLKCAFIHWNQPLIIMNQYVHPDEKEKQHNIKIIIIELNMESFWNKCSAKCYWV